MGNLYQSSPRSGDHQGHEGQKEHKRRRARREAVKCRLPASLSTLSQRLTVEVTSPGREDMPRGLVSHWRA